MKRIQLLALLLLAGGLAQAQSRNTKKTPVKPNAQHTTTHRKRTVEPGSRFNFSLGITASVSNTVNTEFTDAGGTATLKTSAGGAGLLIYPKFSIISTPGYSISIGIPIILGASGSANSREGGSLTYIYDLPLVVDYNGGIMAPANRHSDSHFGYFGGIGFGVEKTSGVNYEYENPHGYMGDYIIPDVAKSAGILLHGGVVFRVGGDPEHSKYFGARLAYKIGLNKDGYNFVSPAVFMNF